MKIGSIMIIIGCILAFWGLLPLFLYGNLIWNIQFIVGGILWIIIGVFINKGIANKNYFMAIFSLITLWGLLLLYIFIFRTNEYSEFTNIFNLQIGLLILQIITFGGVYIYRLKKGNL